MAELLGVISNFQIAFYAFGISFFILGIDDFILDVFSYWKQIGPVKLSTQQIENMKNIEEKRIAIIVPAWKESGIIGRMIKGNISEIKYTNYSFYIGAYPNDPATTNEISDLSNLNSIVKLIVNDQNGPTTKGQMLNCILSKLKHESPRIDAFLMHDAEDLIHPLSLTVANYELESNDFVQIPVLSLPNQISHLVGATYMDEFAESHFKNLPVREKCRAAVPSAGVGTAVSLKIFEYFENWGIKLFNEKSLTEDYELGMACQVAGFKSRFACYLAQDEAGDEYVAIATREFFPKNIKSAVRQKTRWTIGIVLQAWANIGWCGTWTNKYFLFRDRKSIVCNIFVLLAYLFLLYLIIYASNKNSATFAIVDFLKQVFEPKILKMILFINLMLMVNRLYQRLRYTKYVYGYRACLTMIVRIPVSNIINASASLNAVYLYYRAWILREELSWTKTTHRLPENFGVSGQKESVSISAI